MLDATPTRTFMLTVMLTWLLTQMLRHLQRLLLTDLLHSFSVQSAIVCQPRRRNGNGHRSAIAWGGRARESEADYVSPVGVSR